MWHLPTWNYRALRWLLGVLAVGWVLTAGKAHAQLNVSDRLRFSLSDSTNSPFSFLVFGAGPDVNSLRVLVREIRDPDGHSIAADALAVRLEDQKLTRSGSRVFLQPQVGSYSLPGEYQVTLLFEGQVGSAESFAVVRVVTLIREKTTLALDAWRDLTIRLYRPSPWSDASARIDAPIENASKLAVRALSVTNQIITRKDQKDRREITSGRIRVSLPQGGTDIAAGGQINLPIEFSDFGAAGTFQTSLTFNSPSLDGAQRVPLCLEVTDRIHLPLLTIALGVLMAFAVSYVGGSWRKRQQARYRMLLLRSELERLQALCTVAPKLTMLDDLLSQLSNIDRRTTMDEPAGVGPLLDTLEEDIRTFKRAENAQRAVALASLDTMRRQCASLTSKRPEMTPEQIALLGLVKGGIENGETLARVHRIDAVETQIKELEQLLLQLTDELRSRNLDEENDVSAVERSLVLPALGQAESAVAPALSSVQRRLWIADTLLSGFALVIASLTGLSVLYVGKVFGTPADYVGAFLWGFGIDSSIRGVATILSSVRGTRDAGSIL